MTGQKERAAPAATGNGSEQNYLNLTSTYHSCDAGTSQDLAIYRDGRQVGTVRTLHGGQFEAIVHGTDSLGRYNSSFAAARALIERAQP